MPKDVEIRLHEIESQIQTFKNLAWIIGIVASIFGLAGTYGLNLIVGAKTEITKATTDIATLETNLTALETDLENKRATLTDALTTHAGMLSKSLDEKTDKLSSVRVLSLGNETLQTASESSDVYADNVTYKSRYTWSFYVSEQAILFVSATGRSGRENGIFAGVLTYLQIDGVECASDSVYYPDEGGGITLNSSLACSAWPLNIGDHTITYTYQWRKDGTKMPRPNVNWVALASKL